MAKATLRTVADGDSPSQSVVRAANEIFYETDKRGRRIGIKKPGTLQRYRVLKMLGGENAANNQVVGYAMLAYCVREIDGTPVPEPSTERMIEAMIDRLGDDGFEAVGKCLTEQLGVVPDSTPEDTIKN